jgi:hypothetical protein
VRTSPTKGWLGTVSGGEAARGEAESAHNSLEGGGTPTARRGVTLAPAPRHPVACVRGVESYLRNLRDDRVRVVRGDVRVDVRGLMRLRLRVVRLDAV